MRAEQGGRGGAAVGKKRAVYGGEEGRPRRPKGRDIRSTGGDAAPRGGGARGNGAGALSPPGRCLAAVGRRVGMARLNLIFAASMKGYEIRRGKY